jgi:hypothetical protein
VTVAAPEETRVERPVSAAGGARRWWRSWQVALRIARRDAWRDKWRSLLVVAVGVPLITAPSWPSRSAHCRPGRTVALGRTFDGYAQGHRAAVTVLGSAVGARGRHVAGQFLAESGALGLLGGILGTCLGLLVVSGVALSHGWMAILPAGLALDAPAIGLVTGLVAGVYPALRAAAIEPAEALRR